MRDDIDRWWDDLVSKDVTVKFSVTDKEQALKTLVSFNGDNPVTLPGLKPQAIVLVDNTARTKEFLQRLQLLKEEYYDVLQ